MPLTTSGPISISDVATEFGGSTPHSLSEYYAAADGVPSGGSISLSNFYGKSAIPPPLMEYPSTPATYKHHGHSYPNYLPANPVDTGANWRMYCASNVTSNLMFNILSGDIFRSWSEEKLSEFTVEVEYSLSVRAQADRNSTFSINLPRATIYPAQPYSGIMPWPAYATGADPGQTAAQLITWQSGEIKRINEQGVMERVGTYSSGDYSTPRTISGKTYVTLPTYDQYDYQFGCGGRLNSFSGYQYGMDATMLSMKVSLTTDARAVEVGRTVMRREMLRVEAEEAAEKLALAATENDEDKE
jgi:hypothetical protein